MNVRYLYQQSEQRQQYLQGGPPVRVSKALNVPGFVHAPKRIGERGHRANLSHKQQRFTKSAGRIRHSVEQVRLSPEEHEAYRRIILGGQRAAPRRLKAWARTLEKNLFGSEIIEAPDKYAWIANHTREYRSNSSGGDAVRPMAFSDAAKIYLGGLRSREPDLPSAAEWQTMVTREVPNVPRFHCGYGVPGKVTGVFERPFLPVLLPRELIPTIAEELADAIVPRDRGGKRRKIGEMIEAYFLAKIDGTDPLVPRWNFTAAPSAGTRSVPPAGA